MIAERPITVFNDQPVSETSPEEIVTIQCVALAAECFAICDLYLGAVAVLRGVGNCRCYLWLVEHCTDETKYVYELLNGSLSEISTVGLFKENMVEVYGSLDRCIARWKRAN
jgi:hypothetical protein